MLQNGYLSDMQNAILVSVGNDDVERATQLQAKLTKAIEQILNNKHFESVVFGQAVRRIKISRNFQANIIYLKEKQS